MRRKIPIWLLLIVFITSVSVADAQPKKVPRIGYLAGASAAVATSGAEVFRHGLRDLGYVEDRNIVIEYRYAEGKFERLADLAAELVNLKVDLIVVLSTPAAQVVRKATQTIPIVFVVSGDPVENGLVASLARPGGNATGISLGFEELSGKWMELLREAVPKMRSVAVLRNPDFPVAAAFEKHQRDAAEAFRLRLQIVPVRKIEELSAAFDEITKSRAGGLLVDPTVFFNSNYHRVVQLAATHRLPAIYGSSRFADAGGLMSYADNDAERMRRAAVYVDKILKGTKPADLPVERAMKFEFVINLKAAKEIGLTIPPNLLVRADKVIR
ncbi:MAG: ABC transporter substrate-binding protein [Deltaproteobacteria bacterium]|nr:ABC transporter substrate-binding protein [Deltaproteobacteria bacterium]